MSKRGWQTTALVATTAVLLSIVHAAFGFTSEYKANQGAKRISLASGDGPVTTGTSDGVMVGSTTIKVPANTTGIIVTTFSAETICNFGNAGDYCYADVYVIGPSGIVGAFPGGGMRFDADDSGDNYAETHAFQKSTVPLSPGTYTVRARIWVATSSTTTITIGKWHLSAEFWRAT